MSSTFISVYPNTKIINVTFDEYKIVIHYFDQSITINAYGECCSTSKFKFPIGYINFDEIFGKTLISIEEINEDDKYDAIELKSEACAENDDDCVIMHYYDMKFTDNSTFNFALKNTSNGYYDGWIGMTQNHNKKIQKLIDDVIVTIIVGLPGSGKSYLSKKLANNCQCQLHNQVHNQVHNQDQNNKQCNCHTRVKILDDNLSNHEEFIKNVKLYKELIINDPRFCDPTTFERFITIVKSLLLPDNIKIILFENDPKSCIQNIIVRETNLNKNLSAVEYLTILAQKCFDAKEKDYKSFEHLVNFVKKYSPNYDLNNKVYNDYSCTIVPVWKQ